MDVIEAIHTRRSIRDFATTPVEPALIEAIILDAAWAPPPFSGQSPWTFTVIQGVETIAAHGAAAQRYARDHRPAPVAGGSIEPPGFKIFWDAPVVVVISGPLADCCRAGQTLMLSAHARGLGTCWVGSPLPWLKTAEARAALAIPPELEPAAVLCLGYALTKPPTPPRERPRIIWAG